MTANKLEFTENKIPDLVGYVIIVTGGNGGIGYETTRQLALRGARVYIASRSADRVLRAIEQMQDESPDTQLDVQFLKIDLQDLKSVKEAAATFMQKEQRLDILINSAGIMSVPFKLTADGFETQWQVNYMAPFVLIAELLPILLSTAAQSKTKDRVRIVNVASDAAFVGGGKTIRYDDVNLTKEKGFFEYWNRYGHSKQAIIRLSNEINDRFSDKGITAYSLHPGFVKSGLQGKDPGLMGTVSRFMMAITPATTPLKGSLTTLFAATSPDAPPYAQGKFLMPIAKLDKRADKWFQDRQGNTELWEYSEGIRAKV